MVAFFFSTAPVRWNAPVVLLQVLLLLLSTNLIRANLLDTLRDALAETTGWDLGDETNNNNNNNRPHYYTEDKVANALMMADFVDTPLYLVALFKYRDPVAVYEDGRVVANNFTGFDADSIYTQAMFSDIVPNVGGEAKLVANIEQIEDLVTDDTVDEFDTVFWNAVAVIEFPNGLAFGKMLTNQRFQDLTPHKKAGLEYHAIFACELIPNSADVDVDADADDMEDAQDTTSSLSRSINNTTSIDVSTTPVSTVDLVDYKRYADYPDGATDTGDRYTSGATAADKYFDSVTPVERDHGMRTASIFKIKYSLMADSDDWDEVHIRTYPSDTERIAAMDAVRGTVDQSLYHLKAGTHRVKTFETGPVFFNSLGGNDPVGYYEACTSNEAVALAGTMEHDLSALCP